MESKTCIIELKNGIGPSGFLHGWRWERLVTCCDTFQHWFGDTGNRKLIYFNQSEGRENNGFNLVTRGSQPTIVLRADTGSIVPSNCEDQIKFCPFCSAKVEIKVVKVVELKPKTKEVPDGYEEIVLTPIQAT